jgi:hypothetical protein
MTTTLIKGKDLTKEAPRSPRTRLGNYVIMARMIDKGRAVISGNVGEFHFDCPLDNMLFGFKGVKGSQVKELLEQGKSDEEILAWFDKNGTPKTSAEVKTWSDELEAYLPYNNEEKKEWFISVTEPLGLDPAKTTLFGFLDADDKTIGKA